MSKSVNELPPEAKMVFKGEIFEVWQWKQKMFDGSVETFEKLRRTDTAQVIAAVGDKILVEIQEQPDSRKPFVSLPGGKCEWGEDPLVGAKRELLEETGYASDDWTLWKEQAPAAKIIWTVYTYIAKNCVYKEPQRLDAGEKISTKLISFDEFLMLSEDEEFYEKELGAALYRARYDKKFREEFHRLIFGK